MNDDRRILCAVIAIASISRGLVDLYTISRGGVRGKGCGVDLDNLGGIAFGERFCQDPIDIVYTWVNGSDPVWLREMTYYRALDAGEDPHEAVAKLDGSPVRKPVDATLRSNMTSALAALVTNASSVAACRLLLNQTLHGSPLTSAQLTAQGLPRHCNCTALTEAADALASASGQGEADADGKDDQSSANRYRDNEELRFSMRSLFKYAPWVRKVFLVTNGQVPSWLDLEHPRVDVISHSQIFADPNDLPVFSSPAIEVHLHRIPGLSKRFIYFNDDVMLGADTWPEDFYAPGAGHKVYFSWEVPKCNPGCIDSWIGDGFCDRACNNSRCMWDAADCSGPNVKPGAGMSGAAAGGRSSGGGGGINSHTGTYYCAEGCPATWLGDKTCDAKCEHLNCGFDAADCGAERVYGMSPGADAVCVSPSCDEQVLLGGTNVEHLPTIDATRPWADGCEEAATAKEMRHISRAQLLIEAGAAVAAEGVTDARVRCVERWRKEVEAASNTSAGFPAPSSLNETECAQTAVRDLEALRTGDLEGQRGVIHVRLDPIAVDLTPIDGTASTPATSSFHINISSLSIALGRTALAALGCPAGMTAGDARNLTSGSLRRALADRIPDSATCRPCTSDEVTGLSWTAAEYEEESASWLPHAVLAAHSEALVGIVSAVPDNDQEELAFASALLPTIAPSAAATTEEKLSLQEAVAQMRLAKHRCASSACEDDQMPPQPSEADAERVLSGHLPTALMAWTAGAYRRSKSFRLRPRDTTRVAVQAASNGTATRSGAVAATNVSMTGSRSGATHLPQEAAAELHHGVATELATMGEARASGAAGGWADDRWGFGLSLQQSAALSRTRASQEPAASVQASWLSRHATSAGILPAPGTPFVVARTTITLSANVHGKRYEVALPLSVVRRVPQPKAQPVPEAEAAGEPRVTSYTSATPPNATATAGRPAANSTVASGRNSTSVGFRANSTTSARKLGRKGIPIVSDAALGGTSLRQSPDTARKLEAATNKSKSGVAWSSAGLARRDAALAVAAALDSSELPAEPHRRARRLSTQQALVASPRGAERRWWWWWDSLMAQADASLDRVTRALVQDTAAESASRLSTSRTRVLRMPLSFRDAEDAKLSRLQSRGAGTGAATLRTLVKTAWARLVRATSEVKGTASGLGEQLETGAPSPVGRRRLDTYGDSLVFTNALISSVVGRKTRKVPAHMPHLIDREEMEKLQKWEPMRQAWKDTSKRRFRDPNDVQYAFAFFYWIMEAAGAAEDRQGSEMLRFWQRELDADGDGHLNDNELRTLAAVVKGGPLKDGDLARVKACVAPPGNATRTVTRAADGSVADSLTVVTPAITLASIRACQQALEGVQRKVKARMPATHTVAEESEVAFEMVGDNFNETLDKLDSVRARRAKFICINDDMDEAPIALQRILRQFFVSYFPDPSPFELPEGRRNPHLYVTPLKAHHRMKRWLQLLGGLVLVGVAGVALAQWRSKQEGHHKRRADEPHGSSSGNEAPEEEIDAAASLDGQVKRRRRVSFSEAATLRDGNGNASASTVAVLAAASVLGPSPARVAGADSSAELADASATSQLLTGGRSARRKRRK